MNHCNEKAVVRTYTVNLVTSGKGRKTTEVVVHVPDSCVEPVRGKLVNGPTVLEVVALGAIVGTANSIFLERKLAADCCAQCRKTWNRAVPDSVIERLVYPNPVEPCSYLPGGLAANSHSGGSARPNPSPAAVRACLESYPQCGRRQNIVGEPDS